MFHTLTSPKRLTLALLAPVAALLAGCGSSAGNGVSGVCQAPSGPVIAAAVDQYVQKVTPTPRQFLVQPVGDSALPDAGREVLQNKGPTFLFPSDPTRQTTMLAQLEAKGSYPTLLVLYGGVQQLPDGRAVVRLTSRFVQGADSGAVTPARAMYFECNRDDRSWHFTSAEDQKAS